MRKQPAWSLGTRNPKNRHTYQLYLDEVPALRRALLGDAASRAAYDAELAVARRGEREARLDELQRRVRLRAAKGGIGSADRELLAAEARRLGLDDDDLSRLIRPIPGLAESAGTTAGADEDVNPPADVLDPSSRRQIRTALEHLGRRDLYDALGVTRDATASDIAIRADAERQRWMKKAQVTAEKTAWLEVITHAQSHLGTARARARYDRTLAMEAEEAFAGLAEFGLKGLGRLDPGTRASLVAEAGALGIAPDRADRLVTRASRRLNVVLDSVSSSAIAAPAQAMAAGAGYPSQPANGSPRYALVRCRHCGGVTEVSPVARKAASSRCPHCGSSLRWDCPVCRRTPWVNEPRCPCGFRLARLEPVLRHFEAAQQAFRGFDLEAAAEHLEHVLELTPDHAGAERTGPGAPAPGRRRATAAGLPVGAGRGAAGRRSHRGRVVEPRGRPAHARYPGRVERADPPAPPGRGAGGPGASARADGPARRPQLLPTGAGGRR